MYKYFIVFQNTGHWTIKHKIFILDSIFGNMQRKKFDEQINELNKFLQDRSILLLASLIITYFLSRVQYEQLSNLGKMGIVATCLMIVFLFILVIYQMFSSLCDYNEDANKFSFCTLLNTIKRINYAMLI